MMHLVADIGGTHARFAQVDIDSGELEAIGVFHCSDFATVEQAFKAYIEAEALSQVQGVCAAVAGPVESDWIDLPNNHWQFSCSSLQQSLGIPLQIINDFSAQVLALDAFKEEDFHWIGSPRPEGKKVKAVLGPGTGLGVSALMPGGQPLPSEAGHLAFAPIDEREVALLEVLWRRFDRVSVERLLSGMGLSNLYWANSCLEGEPGEMSPEQVTAGALAGDSCCCQAMFDFFSILASVAGEVALMMGAEGGVYLSGGMLEHIKKFLSEENFFVKFLDEENFRRRFELKGRFSAYCEKIPLAIVQAPYPGLSGCVQALKNNA